MVVALAVMAAPVLPQVRREPESELLASAANLAGYGQLFPVYWQGFGRAMVSVVVQVLSSAVPRAKLKASRLA